MRKSTLIIYGLIFFNLTCSNVFSQPLDKQSKVDTTAVKHFIEKYITSLNNYPFINPKFSNETKLERVSDYIKNVPLLIIQSIGLIHLASNNIIYYGSHTLVESFYYISIYCIFIEANYYAYHRFIHKYYYENVHKKHHSNVIVYQLDYHYFL